MFVRVDTLRAIATLEEPVDTLRFHVEVVGADPIEPGLARFGRLAPEGHALIDIDAIKAAAAGRVPDSWIAAFEQMLEDARAHGWIDEESQSIKAHVQFVEAPKEKRRFLR